MSNRYYNRIYHFKEEKDFDKMEKDLRQRIRKKIKEKNASDVVLLCVGAYDCLGDSIGPKLGERLKGKVDKPYYIYGCQENELNALTLEIRFKEITEKHKDAVFILVDSCLKKKDTRLIGNFVIRNKGAKPASAVGKQFEEIGDISILAIVGSLNGTSPREIVLALSNTCSNTIEEMVDSLHGVILKAIS